VKGSEPCFADACWVAVAEGGGVVAEDGLVARAGLVVRSPRTALRGVSLELGLLPAVSLVPRTVCWPGGVVDGVVGGVPVDVVGVGVLQPPGVVQSFPPPWSQPPGVVQVLPWSQPPGVVQPLPLSHPPGFVQPVGGGGVTVVDVRHPVCAGFVRPMPWLRSHSYPALWSDPFGYWPFGFLSSAFPTQPAHGLPVA
jgi:hypothetical protein